MKREENKLGKKGQITIFVIIAIVIVAAIGLVFYQDIRKWINPSIKDFMPNDCIGREVKYSLNQTMIHGGLLSPELYFNYNNEAVNYICYTSEWYKTCVMQNPMLKQDIEKEVLANSSMGIKSCINNMKRGFEKIGYAVQSIGSESASISIVPDKITVALDMTLNLECRLSFEPTR